MRSGLTRLAWGTLAFNVSVILMGAVVRATGSGAGCGRSWPTCHGQVLPELEGATAIEYTHRGLSGVALLLVGLLALLVWRRFGPGEQARVAAVWSLAAIIGEALIGAGIVLFEWVADDTSVARAVSVPLHLLNTFLLLAALTVTAHLVSGGVPLRPSLHRRTRNWLAVGAVAFVLIAATGAVTALADTLFPRSGRGSVAVEHFLTDLRVLHPIVALVVVLIAGYALIRRGVTGPWVNAITILVVAQLASGALVIALDLPLWLRLTHLALADGLWITYVMAGVRLLAGEQRFVEVGS